MSLSELQLKYAQEIEDYVSGSCSPNFYAWEDKGLSDDDVMQVLAEADVNECSVCGWWLYGGEYCTDHDHDEIVCHHCCEDEQE